MINYMQIKFELFGDNYTIHVRKIIGGLTFMNVFRDGQNLGYLNITDADLSEAINIEFFTSKIKDLKL